MPAPKDKNSIEYKEFCRKKSERMKGVKHPLYGTKRSESVKEKMSNSHKGKKFTEEHKNNIRISMIGKNKGKERPDIKGIKRPSHSLFMSSENNPMKTPEMREWFSQNNPMYVPKYYEKICGENCYNWKGGKSQEEYCVLWYDKDYKESIKIRDNYKCLNPECSSGECLHIHHINYNKKDCSPKNLITVCRSCNTKANYNRKWHKKWYQAIMYRRYGYIY